MNRRKLFVLERLKVGDIVHVETGNDMKSYQCIQEKIDKVSSTAAFSGDHKYPVEWDPTTYFTFPVSGNVEWRWEVYRDYM